MVIRTRPFDKEQEKKVENIIKRGGSTLNHKQDQEPYRLTLRIPDPLKLQLDELLKTDPVQPSLTSWILEAIKNKLQQEKKL